MLFNSLIYLCAFLPIIVFGYYVLSSNRQSFAQDMWLVAGSLVFYCYWVPKYFPLIIVSITVNFLTGWLLGRQSFRFRKILLVTGLIFNIGLLGYYKYADFVISNIYFAFDQMDPPLLKLILPLGISFYTFQQISYLVDSYKGLTQECSFLRYSLFVSFFPQLIAGPIVHHSEMMPQFAIKRKRHLNWENIYAGIFLLAIGLFKKVAIADTFAVWVNKGFDAPSSLGFWSAWATSVSYSVQIYFDFSGYMDMAMGSALFFNIKLPRNFNSPYAAFDIQDFWKRWHITLGRFLRSYIYIPLGGNKRSLSITLRNLFATFLIGGIWHGAGWTFVIWGALHGSAMVIHRLWRQLGLRMPKGFAWFLTFMFVNATWVYFRAATLSDANVILSRMLSFNVNAIEEAKQYLASISPDIHHIWIGILWMLVLQDTLYRNSHEWVEKLRPSPQWTLAFGLFGAAGMIFLMNLNRFSEFIYFQF